MADPRHALGLAAEAAVERWLDGAGWRILARRCRPPTGGEIDLLALDSTGVLVAIEVRARRSPRAGSPATSVGIARINRLRCSLAAIAPSIDRPYRGLRLDLVAVEPVVGAPGRWRLVRYPGIG